MTAFGVSLARVGRSPAGRLIDQRSAKERELLHAEIAAELGVDDLKAQVAGLTSRVAALIAENGRLLVKLEKAQRKPAELPAHAIVDETAAKHGISIEALRSEGQRPELVNARWEAMYRLCAETHLSLNQMGRLVGRDHSSISHGVRQWAMRHGLPLPRGMCP